MTQKEVTEFATSFSAYLSFARGADNIDSAECANLATEMVKHLINKFPTIKQEMFWVGDAELLEGLGIQRCRKKKVQNI